MRKDYKAPQVNTETVKVGVFGDYGDCGDGGGSGSGSNSWFGFFNPFFGICCGGG